MSYSGLNGGMDAVTAQAEGPVDIICLLEINKLKPSSGGHEGQCPK